MDLASRHGIPLSDRSCYDGYVWDGLTLALNFHKPTWDEDYERIVSMGDPVPFDDFDLAHEIAHFVVADPVEREFPEWGCMVGIVGHGATGGLSFGKARTANQVAQMNSLMDGVLTKEEQNFREACADFLAVHWCDQMGVHVEDTWRPVFNACRAMRRIGSSSSRRPSSDDEEREHEAGLSARRPEKVSAV